VNQLITDIAAQDNSTLKQPKAGVEPFAEIFDKSFKLRASKWRDLMVG
jgi:hypothetical protein